MYVSHPVRRIQEDPIADESIALVVGYDEGETSADEVADGIEAAGGEVVAELPFEALKVRVEQEDVGAICGVSGLVKVETANTISPGGDPL